MYKCAWFGIKELVSREVYEYFSKRYGEAFCWKFFDSEILQDLDTIRESWGRGIIINNWASGGNLSQCGLRSNVEPLVKAKTSPYLGGHNLACGFDLHDSMGNNSALWERVRVLINAGKLKKFRRLENLKSTPTWVHVDALQTTRGKLEIFNV